MKKKILLSIALLCCTALVCLAFMADISGRWKGAYKTPSGDHPVEYLFKVDGESLTGAMSTGQGQLPLTDGKISGNEFVFTMNYNGAPLKNVGKFYGDSITIDAVVNEKRLHAVLTRVVEKK
ncbi:hypothetical protein [Mucilaginibacter myungsuensis]|uniref:Glycoside hydrolase n=1 Tax=Mucilaginibacter myungsuensis TaxID=649104 RepID=A0A929PZA5_9SPHI|nr:hypothetical protein [Mucilaginibacter myungsuensis]MBE9664295.1 hypothetical protein [Mucilaginibacter myungsuensis]MDN3599999.1 hypothetical protein [Mucilaginibacter myungsuensis]